MNADCDDCEFSRPALGLVIAAVVAGLAGLWWASVSLPNVAFLPSLDPAEWIVYPTAPSAVSHPLVELPVVFESSFVLDNVPSVARLRIAGFRQYTVTINGDVLGHPLQIGANWKRPDLIDAASHLRLGTNHLEVKVVNPNGPPALWLCLDLGRLQVNSGPGWRASSAGAAWQEAIPAAAPRRLLAYSAVYGLPEPVAALKNRWPAVLVLAALSIAVFWLMRTYRRLPPPASSASPSESKPERRSWLGLNLPFVALAGLWIALFANNLQGLPYMTGFDAQGHVDYIRYILEHHSLPLATQGWEMFQAPFYYVLSAAWLGLLHLSPGDMSGITALRVLGLVIGLTHLAIVSASLRLLLPCERSQAELGICLAAFLPPLICLSQYITNEAFAAMLVSACLWLTLRALQQELLTWKICTGLGLCLGAALLAKATALLVVPAVFAALFWKWQTKRAIPLAQWAARLSLVAALCVLLGGWHYLRLWSRYGNPLVGNWDSVIGKPWWQDDGYRTGAFYLRFGASLLHPWSAASQSFFDGMYATLWGDGLLSGAVNFLARPLWNCDFMAIGYWLALLPMSAVILGLAIAVLRFIRRPSAEWFLLLGFGLLTGWAVVYMSLKVPYYSLVKSVFGLPALIPFCAFGAVGLDSLVRKWSLVGASVCTVFVLWAATSYASYWISRSSVPWTIEQAGALVREERFHEAVGLLGQRLRDDPKNADLQFALAYFLTITGQPEVGASRAAAFLEQHPGDCRGHYVLALSFAQTNQAAKAIEELRQILALSPSYDIPWDVFSSQFMAPERSDETVNVCRQALAADPFCAGLRLALGSALILQGKEVEASAQFRYAHLLKPGSVNTLSTLAWRLATSPQAAQRNGPAAVSLAQQVCALTGGRTVDLNILAAAFAEAGRFAEATRTAEQAEASALALGDSNGAAASRQLLALVKAGKPYREK